MGNTVSLARSPTRGTPCSASKQRKLYQISLPQHGLCSSRSAKISFEIRILALADRGSDPEPFCNFLHPLISLFSDGLGEKFCFGRRTDGFPFLDPIAGFDHLSMKRRKFLHQLFLNSRPQMEIAEGHFFHSYFLQSSEHGRGPDFCIRDEGDRWINPDLRNDPNLLQSLNILQPLFWRWSPRFIFSPVSLREGDQADLGQNLL